jgi:hypothetical protein
MKHRGHAPIVASLASGVAGTVVAAAPARAAPPSNGCPAGYQLLSVPALTAEGYQVAALVDSPASALDWFGRPGNGDDWVCGVHLGNQLTPFGVPVYNFIDNQLPASR